MAVRPSLLRISTAFWPFLTFTSLTHAALLPGGGFRLSTVPDRRTILRQTLLSCGGTALPFSAASAFWMSPKVL